ncbi:Soluble starch synthase 3, chloroplastic/amyloplastic [Sesamum angolense]|uniref:starch synthase n=1 Tax=Sesamum angolense TaxID=2727404 RepID=A0AAE2BV96_9LAMI|nr:Soluble starch synthase 3, chloroplastic/amyloplastic [Sesamum angolense]
MEVPLPLQRTVLSERTQSKIKPFLGFLPGQVTLRLNLCFLMCVRVCVRLSNGRRIMWLHIELLQVRTSQEKGKGKFPPVPKVLHQGICAKNTGPYKYQRRDQKNNEEKEGPDASSPQEFGGSNAKTPKEVVPVSQSLFDDKIGRSEENGRAPEVGRHVMESKDAERITKYEVSNDAGKVTAPSGADVSVYGREIDLKKISSGSNEAQWRENMKKEGSEEENSIYKMGINALVETDSRIDETENTSKSAHQVNDGYTSNSKNKRSEDHFLKLKLESEEILRKEALARLAEDNFRKGNKLFYYPELVKPDQDIEIYFNRSFSTLKNEPDIIIMGAFNDWKWKSFTLKLNRSHLSGDWWSCQFHVPKEAYKIDFVFYNGHDVYDNNDKQDFCITVEGGMDVFDFEDFMLEEKRKEQEELVRQKAEKERQAEEQWRIEAERAASEADRAQAREEVEKRKGTLQELMKKAIPSSHSVWYIWPSEFECNDMIKLYYNRSSGPLSDAKDIWLHGGHNGWKDGLSIISKLIKAENKVETGGMLKVLQISLNALCGNLIAQQLVVDSPLLFLRFKLQHLMRAVTIPDRALVLDWVFADGPPQQAITYDNNGNQDFHAIIPNSIPEELYWAEEEQQIYKRLQAERWLREEAARAKAEKTARLKAETKEKTLRTFSNTVLNGKSEIWLRCSFNRWTHRLGPLLPQRMIPAENGSHLKATVKVPLDAYMMDFVFSEKEDGGIFDNKNGMDYHIPVFGGVEGATNAYCTHSS